MHLNHKNVNLVHVGFPTYVILNLLSAYSNLWFWWQLRVVVYCLYVPGNPVTNFARGYVRPAKFQHCWIFIYSAAKRTKDCRCVYDTTRLFGYIVSIFSAYSICQWWKFGLFCDTIISFVCVQRGGWIVYWAMGKFRSYTGLDCFYQRHISNDDIGYSNKYWSCSLDNQRGLWT